MYFFVEQFATFYAFVSNRSDVELFEYILKTLQINHHLVCFSEQKSDEELDRSTSPGSTEA